MVAENINPIINYIQECCKVWEAYNLSWFGRTAAVKMVLLPKLISVFLNVILDLQSSLLNNIQAMLNKFI